MSKNSFFLTLLAVLVFLVGCRSTTSPPPPMSPQYWTALEAYKQIRPAMLNWHEDAIVTDVDSLLPSSSSDWCIQSDGSASVWAFEVISPGAEKLTMIYLTNGVVEIGIDRLKGYEISFSGPRARLPMERMIDSDKVVNLAIQSGVDVENVLLRMETTAYGTDRDGDTSLAWVLNYAESDDPSYEYRVLIDVVTGEIIDSDFAHTPPPPTLDQEPVSDQLLIRGYGEFDLHITNPQGQALGIDIESGKPIAEIPDAGYDSDSDIMTEDSIHLASALIMNPIDGHYRVRLLGLGKPEKQCRLYVEARTGTGEEVSREIAVTYQEGVPLLYEFDLSMSEEKLLSEVKFVKE